LNQSGKRKARILVVDDEADIRGLLKEILSEEGYEVDVAANAAQARASRARQIPDLVLLDIWMPDVDGITLLREWSAAAADGCPVVMMSGHGTVETAVEATRLGAFDFVEKPLSLDEIAAATGLSRRQIERLFKRHLNCVPKRYYLQMRLRRARELLLQTSMPIIDITTACGFQSPPHFSRCYRAQFGCPPSAERQSRPRKPGAQLEQTVPPGV